MIRSLCVFCGSSTGNEPIFSVAARELGRTLAQQGIALVYGGGSVGLMNEVANAALAEGGHVIGVIPQALVDMEVVHRGLPDLRIVHSMHERKALMADLSDAFIAMPGGFGTLEELFEVMTWAQLGFHQKPCGLLNVQGYYDHLLQFLDHCVDRALLRPMHRHMLVVSDQVQDLLKALQHDQRPHIAKWLERDEL